MNPGAWHLSPPFCCKLPVCAKMSSRKIEINYIQFWKIPVLPGQGIAYQAWTLEIQSQLAKSRDLSTSFELDLFLGISQELTSPIMASASQFGPFDAGPLAIEERFSEQGRKRQDIVWKIYVQQDGVAAPFFDKTGSVPRNYRTAISRRCSISQFHLVYS